MRVAKPKKKGWVGNLSSILGNDPVYSLVGNIQIWAVWVLILLFYVTAYVAVGFEINYLFPTAKNILRITDLAEIVNGINVWVIFVPAIWAYYRWFPENVLNSFMQIEKRGVISSDPAKGSASMLSATIARRLVSKWVYLVAGAATLVSALYLIYVVIPNQEKNLGLIDFWYYTWWSKSIFLLLYLPVNFVMFAYLMRALITVFTINHFFQQPSVIQNLYPLHADKCGGMGEIGGMVSKTLLIVVLVPVWNTIFSLYTILAGGETQFVSSMLVYLVYIILVPVILMFPLWEPHKAMERYKNEELNQISKELLLIKNTIKDKIQTANHNEKVRKELERYKQLQELHENLDKHIPVWPISLYTLRSFGTIAGSPAILGFLFNILVDYLKQHYFS